MKIYRRIILVWAWVSLSGLALAAAPNAPTVDVFLWFDTEDYLLPEADESLLRIATFLEGEGIQATFKLVGEKARVLQSRGRTDILRALASHDIGYHTDFHSVHPTPAEFLSNLGWFEGVTEFKRRQDQGFKDVWRITGQMPSCYGQPGSSWGPQVYGALQDWGVRVYLDDTRHIDVSGRPFYYGGILNLLSLEHTLRTELGGSADLDEGKRAFEEAYRELAATGGIISIYYHPCEFAHAQFWDGVNFSHGANPGRGDWKVPPMKAREEIETAHRTFEAFVQHIKTFPQVRFRTSRSASSLYPDRAYSREFSRTELLALARSVTETGITYFEAPDYTLSAAETFTLLVRNASDLAAGRERESYGLESQLVAGPVRPAVQSRVAASGDQFLRTLAEVEAYLNANSRVPDDVWLGSRAVSPESFLKVLAAHLADISTVAKANLTFEPVELLAAHDVRSDKSLWGWVIFPTDFDAPEMMELAKRQAWTLKPALRLQGE